MKKKFNLVSEKIYEWGDKTGKQLARSLRKKKSASFISKVKLPLGEIVNSTPQIAAAFREFYVNLYNIEGDPTFSFPAEKCRRI